MINTVAGWFNAGGPFMWVITVVLALASAVTFERLLFYYIICSTKGTVLVSSIAGALNEKREDLALSYVKTGKSPLVILIRTALERFNSGMSIEEVQEGVEETAIKQIPRYTQRLNYLSLFANIATLLGLLGTISGLMISFSSLAAVEASRKAMMLADGISQAMITTAFGLIVAVPCMVLYTFLFNKQNRLIKDLDESVVKFVNYLKKQKN
ncbi:MAG TPA: MotA/TolQ/ExbB proton channel family protein [Chitinispirillaceae bacterium]|nr:MotA/TolQ/ExbB proton channel family protein [Chitinispirillaceae bacterium]